MKIEITMEGVTRTLQGDYDELFNQDWCEIVRDFIDTAHDWEKLNNKEN
jgi:hypothetical protein